jgi:hypothetical protein
MPDSIQPPAVEDAPIPPVTAPVVTAATLTDDGYLDSVLQRLRSLSDKAAIKKEKIKEIQSSKTLGLVCGQAKPNMISSLRAAKSKSNELKVIEAKKREGTYTCDKKTLFLDYQSGFSLSRCSTAVCRYINQTGSTE